VEALAARRHPQGQWESRQPNLLSPAKGGFRTMGRSRCGRGRRCRSRWRWRCPRRRGCTARATNCCRRRAGRYTDVQHYRLYQPEGALTLYNEVQLEPPGAAPLMAAFTSCRRFSGRFFQEGGRPRGAG
jgi:hypothetical protein